ncbi:hypothetical protein QBC33DRAFT_540283 [Phialemonium atrogriseum]|uniref:Uncharacterized protein n=1 Tax=Phialemonium atrogriseum TaxID=1093897 RepID=A0AAJ0C161_9PEZI|nr:uncharacterized protein QBC33DRAFT_540283 [Phialemonium atrogriseum]KAK1766804.1 hypothetical protein QBC33DRAFT_540283 [Phialemonium atrogriseum]
MLTRRLLAPQSALSPWGTAARFTIPHRRDQTRRAKSSRTPPDASNEASLYDKLFPGTPPATRTRPRQRHGNPPAQKPLRSALIRDMKAWGWGEKSQPKTESQGTQSPRWGERYIRGRESQNGEMGDIPLGRAFKTPTNQPPETSNGTDTDEGQSYNGPAVLVLNSASKSLLESDFYRLGRQGQHLDGWASGIVKVVQARSPTTQEPLGQYFIHFDSRAAAMAYMDEVMRLLSLSRQAAGSNWDLSPRDPTGPLPLAPKLGATRGGEGDTDASVQAFTLIPPSAALNLKLRLPEEVESRRHGQAGRRNGEPGIGGGIWSGDGGRHAEGKGEHHKVLVWLDGSQVTADTLLGAIEDDGKDRNLAWRLQDGPRSIAPIPGAGFRNALEKGPPEKDDPTQQRARFIVSFAEAVEARRFARSWHKRELSLPDRDRTMVVNATALW